LAASARNHAASSAYQQYYEASNPAVATDSYSVPQQSYQQQEPTSQQITSGLNDNLVSPSPGGTGSVGQQQQGVVQQGADQQQLYYGGYSAAGPQYQPIDGVVKNEVSLQQDQSQPQQNYHFQQQQT
jgi:hypothetical protein